MKKTESNNLEVKKPTIVKLKGNVDNSSKNRNPNPDQERTQGTRYKDFINSVQGPLDPNEGKLVENSEIVENLLNSEEKNYSEQMDEIIRNNDKFETISVLISVLCRELGIHVTNQPGVIGHAIKKVYDDYYKSMEDWKNLTKQGLKNDIRQ